MAERSETPDADLVASLATNLNTHFETLVVTYQDRLYAFALRLTCNRQDAEEVTQDAFVRAYRALARCGDPDRFGSWLFSILVNRCRTTGARTTRRARTFVSDEAAERVAVHEHPAEQAAWREEIGRALAQIDTEQREAFLLKHVEGLSYDEMAELTGAGVSALKMRVKRACDRLRGLLQEAYSA